jgi:hypothetical protein
MLNIGRFLCLAYTIILYIKPYSKFREVGYHESNIFVERKEELFRHPLSEVYSPIRAMA